MHKDSIDILREAAPYIQRHRDRLFVVYLDSRTIDTVDDAVAAQLIKDIALLHCFGVRLVTVFGVRTQLDRALDERGMPSSFGDHDDWRVTTEEQLQLMKDVVRENQSRIASLLHRSLAHYGADGTHFDVLTDQRLVLARPYGVRGGTDYRLTGTVGKIHTDRMRAQLELGNLILLSPLAPSAQGQFFNLRAIEVALAVASGLTADKLIVAGRPIPTAGSRNFFHAEEFYRAMDAHAPGQAEANETDLLKRVVRESVAHRIGRIHFIAHDAGDSLLTELFTREGSGLLVSCDPYEQFRPATVEDIDLILELYRPTRAKDEILARDKDKIRSEIAFYHLLLCDQAVVGVAALSPLDGTEAAEIHGLAIDPHYRQQGRGRRLALSLIEKARQAGYQRVFALTTQAQDFFVDLGMESVDAQTLPPARARAIPPGRGSKIYRIELDRHSAKRQSGA